MLIKYMKLKNFRQYIDTTIEFATDSERNVTVIMGDNGTGKTTLAQAFQWALYGKTNFQIHELINRNVREQMGVGGSEKVSVVLNIEYNNQEYMIQRIQEYYKNVNQKIEEKEILNDNVFLFILFIIVFTLNISLLNCSSLCI